MLNTNKAQKGEEFEATVKEYLRQAREKLETELSGTREAIRLIARDKTRDFMIAMDKGLDEKEREFLSALIVVSMQQAFCYGYGIGKVEGKTNRKVFL